jgi:hypothetical protein
MTHASKHQEEEDGETDQIIPLTVLAALQQHQQQQQPKLPPRPLPSALQRQQRNINLPEGWIWPAAKFSDSARQTQLFQEAFGPLALPLPP